MLKRVVDIVGSIIGIIVLSPFLVVLPVLIKLNDGGPIFYRGVRIGRGGTPFRIYKFRTMVINADKVGGPSTSDDDPRITKIGLFIRKFKLDEIPQLFNVWSGEMSFVGPRPEVEEEVRKYTEEEKALLSVRPGITDFASIKFHDEGAILKGSPDPHEAYLRLIRPEKIRLGLEYVRNPSLATDFRILFLTFKALIESRSK